MGYTVINHFNLDFVGRKEMDDRKLIHLLSMEQAMLRRFLKQIDPKSEEAIFIRRRMYTARAGHHGLRALNKRLYGTNPKRGGFYI
jgi:hypothetical protein